MDISIKAAIDAAKETAKQQGIKLTSQQLKEIKNMVNLEINIRRTIKICSNIVNKTIKNSVKNGNTMLETDQAFKQFYSGIYGLSGLNINI